MLIKRLSVLVLALSIAFTGIVAAAENDMGLNEKAALTESREFSALCGMGFLKTDTADLKNDNGFTRAQFVGTLCRIAGYEIHKYSGLEIPFSDVNINTLYCDEICTMYYLGIINGTDDGMFSPGQPITYAEAVKVIVDVLGYGAYSAAKHGNDALAYVMTAGELRLNKGVETSIYENLSAAAAVRLLYNAARTYVMEPSAIDENGNISYKKNSGKELISSLNKIYYGKGVLQSNGITSLKTNTVDEKNATIDGVGYKIGDLDLSRFLGCNVDFFYKDEDSMKTLLWADAADDNDMLDLRADELACDSVKYTLENIVYYDKSKIKNAVIDAYANVVYNNTICNNYTLDMLKPKAGSIRLIDNNGDRRYDTVIIERFKNIFVVGLKPNGEYIYGKYNMSIDYGQYEYVRVFKNGKKADFADIKPDMLLSIAEDAECEKLFIYINDTSFSETLKSVSTDGGENLYVFDSGEYKVSENYCEIAERGVYPTVEMKSGNVYTVYLDKLGQIAEIKDSGAGGLQYALLVNAVRSGDKFEDDVVKMRMVLSGGQKTIVSTRKKIKLNELENQPALSILNDSRLYDANGEVVSQVVRVAFDANGNVRELKFAVDGTNSEYGYTPNEFSLDSDKNANLKSEGNIKVYDYKYNPNINTLVFIKWKNANDDMPYTVTTGNTISVGNQSLKLYDVDEKMVPAVIYYTLDANAYWSEGYFLVDEVSITLVGNEAKKQISGYTMGGYVSYPESEEGVIPSDIKRGDVLKFSRYNDEVTKINTIVRLSESPEPMLTAGLTSGNCGVFGKVHSATADGIITVNPDSQIASSGKLLFTIFRNKVPVEVYDVKNDEVYIGSMNDITQKLTPQLSGATDENVMAFVNRNSNYAREVIVVYY